MGSNGKIRLYIAGLTALILVIVTVSVLMVLSPGRSVNEESGTSEPSGTVVIESAESQAEGLTEQTVRPDDYSSYPLTTVAECQAVIEAYAADHGIDPFAYPVDAANLICSDPGMLDFVLQYPELIGTQDAPDLPGQIDVSSDVSPLTVPMYYQYDTRWGYKSYAGSVMGLTGGGPTALSMVATYLLGDNGMNPAWMAGYAENNGYITEDGTSWMLMNDGAIGLGIDVTPITADQDRINRNLDVGNIIVCHMGPGTFTNTDQYILITGYSEEGYEIRDPGSAVRTSQLWTFESIAPQMTGCWVMRIL